MRASRGFTLLEAVVALLVVGLAATSALGAFAADARAAVRARQVLVAEALARHRLAVLELAVSDGAPVAGRLPDSLARGSFTPPLADYAWQATANRVANEPGLVEVHVEVRWRDGRYVLDTRWFVEPGAPEAS